jgi:lipopolysaccharide export system permease protein
MLRLPRHLAARALVNLVASVTGVVALFLAVDFAERASVLRADDFVESVAQLYLYRSAVLVWQVAPAAMLLAGAITASGLRKTREYTALRALGFGPWRVAIPILAVCAAGAVALAAAGDVVAQSWVRSDEIMQERFNRTTRQAARAQEQKRWFRSKDGRRIFHLRSSAPGGAFERITVLELGDGFTLARRIDAGRMSPAGEPGAWTLEDVEERTFGAGPATFGRAARAVYRFEEDPAAFQLRAGRAGQMTRETLAEQVALRGRLGLPSADFALEWHRRLSYPLAGITAGLVAVAVALRRNRRGHLTAALLEAVAIFFLYWAVDAVGLSLGHSGRLAPWLAAWLPAAIFLGGGAVAMRRLG